MNIIPGALNVAIPYDLFEEVNSDEETETLDEEPIFVDQNDPPQKWIS